MPLKNIQHITKKQRQVLGIYSHAQTKEVHLWHTSPFRCPSWATVPLESSADHLLSEVCSCLDCLPSLTHLRMYLITDKGEV